MEKTLAIVVFGATGNIGSKILIEALTRDLQVTAVSTGRSDPEPRQNLTVVRGDIQVEAEVAKIASGHEAVISAFSPGLSRFPPEHAAVLIDSAHRSLLAGVKRSEVKRLIIVGGVGSLEASPGIDVVDSDFYPKEHRPHTLRNREILRGLRRDEHELEWTYASPPLHIGPGLRTQKFRLGENHLLRDAAGESRISEEDFAVAILDELASRRFVRQRFTAAY